ncbi:hypothetical protein MBLNU230_g1309t1 [Neophaeotheca triangularis]
MDDAWIHSFTTSSASAAAAKERPQQHARRPSLLEQPQENAKGAIVHSHTIQESIPEDIAWNGPPKAAVARRAQSYSDFYHVARSFGNRENSRLERRRSVDAAREAQGKVGKELAFDDEFREVEGRLLEQSHTEYQSYYDHLRLSESHLESLLVGNRSALSLLANLSDSFQAVEARTEAFRQQCESLLSEQRRLSSLANNIQENARYYTYLEPMTRRLNAPGATNLVKGDDFPGMLANLDGCLEYMEAHSNHQESATYRSRYRLLLTRALTLIRHHFTNSLGDLASDITRRIQGGQLKETTHSALLYAKFRVPAPELKALGVEIQKRAVPTPDDVDLNREPEYASLMRELYQSYSTTRGRLILPLASRKMSDIAANPKHSDLLAFARASMSFMRGICLDEYDLWFEWFETDHALYEFLETLMEPMYDYLRPRTIHETQLENLCALCSMIQGRYMSTDSDDEDDDASSVMSPGGRTNDQSVSQRQLNFGHLVQPALEDAQTRLVFLALAVLRDGIENYRPKWENLQWPKHASRTSNGVAKGPALTGTREHSANTQSAAMHGTNSSSVVDLSEADADDDIENVFSKTTSTHRTLSKHWYPTLPKAIWLLRRLYRLVNSTVFDDLAHRIVHSTIASLLAASSQIAGAKPPVEHQHSNAQLFLVTHLLHLKSAIVAFDIEFIPPDVDFDFSSLTSPFYELRDRGGLWNPASWFRLVGSALVPKVVENMLDAKAELDGRLRTVINDFVNREADLIISPVGDPALLPLSASEKEKIPVNKQKVGPDPLKAIKDVYDQATKQVPVLRSRLHAFIDDERTKETLVQAVRDQVFMGYEEFFDLYVERKGKGAKISRKGKGREDEIWDPDLFGERVGAVFAVTESPDEDD